MNHYSKNINPINFWLVSFENRKVVLSKLCVCVKELSQAGNGPTFPNCLKSKSENTIITCVSSMLLTVLYLKRDGIPKRCNYICGIISHKTNFTFETFLGLMKKKQSQEMPIL